MNKAENALLAKAHALYAKRLTNENYSAMLACRSQAELFAYLKSNTSYGEYLEKLPGVNLSRARFENVMKQAQLERIASLCRFEKLIGESLYKYFITKNEIETVIYCAQHLDTDVIADLFTVPEFFRKEQTVFGETLQEARSFSDLAEYLKDTPYHKVLNSIALSNTQLNLPVLENALYGYLYSTTAETVKKNFKGKQREEILNYFRFLSDMIMIEAFYRLNENYSAADNYKANMYVSTVSGFTDKEMQKLIGSKTGKEVFDVVRSSVYKKYFSGNDASRLEKITREAVVKMCAKNLRFSQNPMVCMLCYSTAAENEIKNITHIIEGIKYNLSPDEISEILVKGEDVCP